MKSINRNHCVITGNEDLEHLHSFKNFPVFMGCSHQPYQRDLKADMSWWISRETGIIQLNPVLPLEVIYQDSHGAGAIGALWSKHHKDFAKFLNKISPTSVMEIGGAHGILAKEYRQFKSIPWTIVDPNPVPVENCDAQFIKGFFDEKFSYHEEFDAVVHSHVFEHIYEPDQFMSHLSKFMKSGKSLIFSLPNMQAMLERKYTNCLNFEHTVSLTEPYVEFLLAKHGFKLLAKEYFMDDHSIFYHAIRDESVKVSDLEIGLYEKNKKTYLDYIRYHEELIRDLNQKISDVDGPIYLFGAHVFAQYLIAFGLDTARITSLLDNDAKKQGKRLYGTNLIVQSPAVLQKLDSPLIILRAGVYNQEIKRDIVENINPSATFLE